MVAACILAGLIALPFFAWDPQAFWKGVVAFQFQQPFRRDSLSVLAAIAAATGVELPAAIGFIVAACVAALCFWRAKPGIGHAALTGSAFFLAFFLFNKQAFLNPSLLRKR